ncbi:MAG: sodium:calcium antiporter [Acidobacteria bacterium]|nr:sodium:calcium antiporter [Acidobacteriota bacterium]
MRLLIALTIFITLPSVYLRLHSFEHPGAETLWGGIHLSPLVESVIFGLGILGAAFLLSWAAEVAQMDMSRGLALAILALIAILPEYAVDLYFAWVAADNPAYAHYATANMTGANRLLVGAGWPLIVLLFCTKFRRKTLNLDVSTRAEISYLALSTLYAFLIVIKGRLTLVDTFFLVGIFGAYMWRTSHMEIHEPELVGPARLVGDLPKFTRRVINVFFFAYSGVVIFLSAEPFAEALLSSGEAWGIDQFLLVQWLAPLASEAPEFIIAALWSLRGLGTAAMGALISSKVNQWSLLVGTIPLVYSISLGAAGEMPLDSHQNQEILLTAAQSLFALLVLVNLTISLLEGGLLFVLFAAQLVYPDIRLEVSALYLVLSVLLLLRRRAELVALFREGLLPERRRR